MSLLDKAIMIAATAHYGQRDKGDKPYILHPLRVMLSLDNEEEKIVGVLHDVLEDTAITEEQIKQAFGEKLLDALLSVTRKKDELYMDYIYRAGEHPIGKYVKIADIKDNMRPERIACLPEKEQGIVKRYERALRILED